MRKIMLLCIILCCFLLMAACGKDKQKNPIYSKDTNERIIMSLEKTYPENKFTVIKAYDEYDGQYYAVCSDENGLEFRVDTIVYDNTYHFGCKDEYLFQCLQQKEYVEKAKKSAESQGYSVEYDAANRNLTLMIDINKESTSEEVADEIYEIIHGVKDLPKTIYPNTGFTTGEVNYYSEPKMYNLLYSFYDEQISYTLNTGSVSIFETENDNQSLVKEIEQSKKQAYINRSTYLEEK
ncbi:hypothetical protein FYJ34_07700 [Clostridiaceae bacterium 68-1-5]|uniref:Uncharacterized protein n=1 Tax=Suipraeoptans intestinalis TaxID=2606628 RepID=A0A6N7USP4_9FIRM|nr:hypothetical protein [Suipraeoptans intestinalis]MSR94143.1 hypothetical protein [Suipraeoptans intestinalis]